MATLRTFGHGTLAVGDLVEVVRDAGVTAVVDIRRYPGSRRHPHLARKAMAEWLPPRGASYRWIESLGGRRRPQVDSRNIALRNPQFRGYADHMASDAFADGIAELTAMPDDGSVAVMCAESVWWRCHRRLLADHLVLVERARVEHLFHDGRLVEHVPMAHARRVDDHVVYDASPERSVA
jgi:uncharacterized protein (DUF488 family)